MTVSPDTVSEACTLLAAEGYTADFNLVGNSATCPVCHDSHCLSNAHIERQFRFEGASDPGDEAIVLGVRCVHCDALGVIVSAYGPDAEPELLQRLGGSE